MLINIDAVCGILKREVSKYQVPIVDLIKIQTNDPFKILIATILSARTKDETTAAACRRLFAKVENFDRLSHLSEGEIQKLIYPVGFYKVKAKHLKQLPRIISHKFQGKIPQTIEELTQLPGVGRKTANLVVAIAFGKPGICVDTHVHRISNRLGYVKTKTPFETEMQLRKKLPKKYWNTFNMLLVAFGQNICRPISPFCSKCPISKYCSRLDVGRSR